MRGVTRGVSVDLYFGGFMQTNDNEKQLQRFWTGVSVLVLWVFFINLACIFIFLVFNKQLTSFEKVQDGFKYLATFTFGLSILMSYIFQLPTVLENLYYKALNLDLKR